MYNELMVNQLFRFNRGNSIDACKSLIGLQPTGGPVDQTSVPLINRCHSIVYPSDIIRIDNL